MNTAYFEIFGYDKNGAVADIKIVRITQNGKIFIEQGLGQPENENIRKEK